LERAVARAGSLQAAMLQTLSDADARVFGKVGSRAHELGPLPVPAAFGADAPAASADVVTPA
jgi:hypothetical protein